MSRAEHLAWCKQRALEYVQAGDLNDAVASMASDLGKHEDTAGSATPPLVMIGLSYAIEGNKQGVRDWIEGFN